MLDGVRKGVADIGVMVVDYWPDRLGLASFSSLPFVFSDPTRGTEILRKLLQGTMGENFRKEGIEPVMILLTTPRQLSLAKNKVRSLDDIRGLKLRGIGNAVALLKTRQKLEWVILGLGNGRFDRGSFSGFSVNLF